MQRAVAKRTPPGSRRQPDPVDDDGETGSVDAASAPMQHALPSLPPRADLRVGSRRLSTAPVHLDGQGASVVVRDDLEQDARGSLRLDWGDGRATELDVIVRRVTGAGLLAEMEVCGVQGDWRPFVEYVGSRAA